MSKPLTGDALLERVNELSCLPKVVVARACGYMSQEKPGQKGRARTNMAAFYEALLEAKGILVGGSAPKEPSRRGRKIDYRVRVQSSGNLLISSAYTKKLGLKPGDEFEIRLGRKRFSLMMLDPEKGEIEAEVQNGPAIISIIPKGSVA